MDREKGKAQPRQGYEAFEAINPEDGKPFAAYIAPKRQAWVARRGKHAIMEMAYLVPDVIRSPDHIYEGIRWDEDEDSENQPDSWICYVKKPSFAFDRVDSTQETEPRQGRVFMVFMNVERVLYNWRWDHCDPSEPNRPVEYGDRFGKEIL